MKILITGTTGFIGAHLLRYFSKNGHEVLAWSRPANPPEGLTDFGTYQSVDLLQEIPKLTVDVCIHCAGYANDEGDWNTFYRNNVETTKNLFQAIQARLWVNISSASIYPLSDKLISENDIDQNNFPSLYGKSKFMAEEFLKKECSVDQTIISLRPRAVYGMNDRVLLPRILNLGKSGIIKLPGGGKVKLSMTHIDNLIHAVELCLQTNLKGVHAFNVADENAYVLSEVMQKVNEGFLNKKIKIKSVSPSLVRWMIKVTSFFGYPFPLTMQAFDYITTPTIININKIKKELGYQPTRNFFGEVAKISSWARSIDEDKIYGGDKELAWVNYDTILK